VAADLACLTHTVTPSLDAAVDRLAERARAESWTHEEFLAACLQRDVATRESHGGEARARAARLPAGKALEDFDYDDPRSLKRDVIAHLGTRDLVAGKKRRLPRLTLHRQDPPVHRTGHPRLPSRTPRRVRHRSRMGRRLAEARPRRRLQDEITKLGRITLLIVGDVGYIPFEAESANLFFQLVPARNEGASLILTSNKPSDGGAKCSATTSSPPMIDRLIHHAEVISLNGDSYRLKDRDLGRTPTAAND
jgi:DNA replication protein DnaC